MTSNTLPSTRMRPAKPLPRLLEDRPLWLLTLAVLVWLSATAWARVLMLPDEGRYVGVAWEMLRSGDWLTPTLNGLPYFQKPPLFYWITAASLAVFGHNEWAARSAPLLGATLAAVSMYAFVHRWAGARIARLSLLALLAQPLCFIGAQFANMDMLVAGCIGASIVLFADAALRVEHGVRAEGSLYGAWAMAALGVLAKGLIGAVLPALVIVAWLLVRRRPRTLRALLSWRGALLFAAIAAPWFVVMQMRHPDFLHYFIVVQHFKRFALDGFNNVQPLWFYPAVLLVFCLPLLPWLAGLRRGRPAADTSHAAVRLLMLLWVAVIVLFFSLPKSKLLGYVLPAVPPLAVLFADGCAALAPTAVLRRRWLASLAMSSLLGLVAVGWLARHPDRSTRALALALAAQVRPGDGIVMLDNYYFDLPFYMRLREPVQVVDAWRSAAVRRSDNWRKELADAGAFAKASSRSALVETGALPALLCRAATTTTWLVADNGAPRRHPFLAQLPTLASANGSSIWRIDATRIQALDELGCHDGADAALALARSTTSR